MSDARRSDIAAILSRALTRRRTKAEQPATRCAIYTRESTEEGLDQEFNSLDAQREAAKNFIASQSQEGWKVVPTHYDDGGYSGGNVDRLAMKRLLEDIAAAAASVDLKMPSRTCSLPATALLGPASSWPSENRHRHGRRNRDRRDRQGHGQHGRQRYRWWESRGRHRIGFGRVAAVEAENEQPSEEDRDQFR